MQTMVNGLPQPSEGSFGEDGGLGPATSHRESSYHSGGGGAHLVWGQESHRRRSGEDAQVWRSFTAADEFILVCIDAPSSP